MSKNLTRKGMAISAVVALGLSLFSGAPAQAAGTLVVEPDAGTSYNVLLSDEFKLRIYGIDQAIDSSSLLHWKVTKPAASSTVNYFASTSSAASAAVSRDASYTNNTLTAEDYIVASATNGVARNTLVIDPVTTSSSVTQSYKVQAFLDRNNNGAFDLPADLGSNEVTVKFVAVAEAAPKVVLDAVGAGQTLSGSVTYAGINHAQTSTGGVTRIDFIENGASLGVSNTTARSTDKSSLEFESAVTAIAGRTYGVKVQTVRYDGDTTLVKSEIVSASVDTSDATGVTTTVPRGANIKYAAADSYKVRKGTTAFDYTVAFTKESGTVALAAGKPVSVTVTEASSDLAVGDSLTVNGNALTITAGSGDTKTFNTVTDAAGKVKISISNASAKTGDEFTVAVTSNDVTNTTTLEYVEPTLSHILAEANEPLGVATRTIVRGSTFALKYVLVDTFGEKWGTAYTDTAYRVNVAVAASPNNGATSGSATPVVFVGGEAVVNYKDESTSNTKYQITASVEGRLGDANWGTTAVTGLTKSSWINPVTTLSTPTKLSIRAAMKGSQTTYSATGADVVSTSDGTVSADIARSDVDLAAIDRRVNTVSVDRLNITNTKGAWLSGLIQNADGSPAVGSAVTVAAPGVYFSTDNTGSTYVSAGSITVNTDVDGYYNVYAFSQKAGKVTATITAGAVSKTQSLKFAAMTRTDGKELAITAPAYTAAGRSVDVSILLTDKFGGAIASGTTEGVVRVVVTGAGSYTTIATTTDSDGLIQFKLIFGANETGTATITATYDKTDDGTREITKSATVTIGSAPATAATAAIAGSTKRFFVSVSNNAAAKNVVVKVAGKTVATLKGSAAKKTYTVAATKGSKKVTVYVGGKLIATKTVTVK